MPNPVKDRPVKETFNPPVDLPFDQTTGGSPPYALPDKLLGEIEGKNDAQLSSIMSEFRTGLSEHRTRLSEHRTDLSEHRTDLSDFRTDLSRHRTELSEHRTALSEHRTGLSDERSHMANERTHLAYIRSALSLITLGISINRFAIFLVQSNRIADNDHSMFMRMRHTEQMGLGMVVLGVAVLLWGLVRYRQIDAEIKGAAFRPPTLSPTLVSLGIIFLGALTAIILMVD
jgi:putative membrane protein